MITKDQLAAAMLRDCDICIHLHSKFSAEGFEYRPGPGQRSTLELLRYLAVCGNAAMRCMAAGDWKLWGEFAAASKEMAAADFPALMTQQKADIEAFFAGVTEAQLETQEAPLPGGRGISTLGLAILLGPLKWLASYKLQLFLYAKACGADIATSNAWAGVDRAN
jgi:hypothetical protein